MGFKIARTPLPSYHADAFKCCAALPDGKVVLVPWSHPSIVVFDPSDGSFEEAGQIDGNLKFGSCALMPDGKVLCVPCNHPSVVLFDPTDKSCEEVACFNGRWKFMSCALLPGGKVLLVPYRYPSAVIFDPADRSCEEVGHFDGPARFRSSAVLPGGEVLLVPYCHPTAVLFNPADRSCRDVARFGSDVGKFSSCALLPDGRVLFVPYCHPSAVLFDPADKTCQDVGGFDGHFKFSSCAVMPNGKVLLVPYNHPSMLLFDPADKSFQDVGRFEGAAKFSSCALTPDGKAVLAPENFGAVIVVSSPTWTLAAMKKQTAVQASEILQAMWTDRRFSDASIVAGFRGLGQKAIPVHRAVLASRSDFFQSLFSSTFREATDSLVHLEDDPEIVEAALQHIYTGRLPEVDILELLPVAHRLGLEDCIVDCAASMHSIPRDYVAQALQVLGPLKGHPAVDAAWDQLVQRVRDEDDMLGGVSEALVSRHGLKSWKHEPLGIAAATQTCPQEVGVAHKGSNTVPRCLQETSSHCAKGQELPTAPDQPSTPGRGSSLQLPFGHFMVLHLHRCPAVLTQVLRDSPLGQDLERRGVNITPSWASGAKVLIDGFTAADLRCNGHDPALLRPWHVVAYVEDVPQVLETLRHLPYHRRPRPKAKLSLRGLVGSNVRTEPARIVPSASLSSFSKELPAVLGGALAGDPVARIDAETADAISKAIAASFLEDHYLTGDLAAPLQVERTFVNVQEEASSCSPRTHWTA